MTQLPTSADIRALGSKLSFEALEGSRTLFTPCHEQEPYPEVRVTRDLAYGADPRQRLDLFTPATRPAAPLPVLLFVHGGGFVGGDKKQPGSPYQDNVALWAVRHGMVGVNMTYRLAPMHPWPAGAEDVGAAVRWVREHVAASGGDPQLIFAFGTSAGTAHVASYVAHPRFHGDGGVGLAGAILASGIYNLETAGPKLKSEAYFGDDPARYAERSSIQGLTATDLPLMIVLAEHEPALFEQQSLELVNRLFERHRRFPCFVRLMGHNHFTTTLHLNTADDYFGRQIAGFVATHRAASP